MPFHTTYTNARKELASLWDRVEQDREVAILRRRGHRDVAMIDAEELAGLRETAHLLRSPANALRLLKTLERSRQGNGRETTPEEIARDTGAEDTASAS